MKKKTKDSISGYELKLRICLVERVLLWWSIEMVENYIL